MNEETIAQEGGGPNTCQNFDSVCAVSMSLAISCSLILIFRFYKDLRAFLK